jgi:hypothetical protein
MLKCYQNISDFLNPLLVFHTKYEIQKYFKYIQIIYFKISLIC